MAYIERAITDIVKKRASTSKCLLLTGARQVGKSTLLKRQFADYNKVTFDDKMTRLQAKEEARKLLTQPVVQISAEQRKTVSQINRESREKRVIHPIETQKRYNSKSAKNGEQAESEAARSEKNEVAVKSSLKKILDDSNSHK